MLTFLPFNLRHAHACRACDYRGSDFDLPRVQRDWYGCPAHPPDADEPAVVVRMSGHAGDYLCLPLHLTDISPMLRLAARLGVFHPGRP